MKSREAIERLNAELSSDLAAMTRLQQLSTRIIEADELNTLLGDIMSAAIEITRADMGNIQLFQNGRFQIVQQHGFQAPFLEFFHEVAKGSAVCGTALERHERVIVEDVAHSSIFTGNEAAREAVLAAGARAVQSTPLISRSGQLLGVLSTHYFKPQQPDASDLRRLDLLSRLAADVIERTSNHESLRISEERFRELADNISQFAWMTDATGSIFWYNQRWYDYTGTTLDEMQGWGWQKVLHPDHVDRVVERFRQAIQHEELWEDTFPLRRANGEWRWFLSRALPIRNPLGVIERWFGTNTDVTEQRETEQKLRHANSDLEQFAYSASHDLQEPLRSVRIYSELLEEHCRDGLDREALEFLGFLKSGASRMQSLIHDLLAYTQVTVADLANAEADSQEALHAALTNLSAAIADSQARVTWDPLPRLPVHRLHLQQLFQNLVGNAIKYGRPNEPPQVHVKAERQNAHWLFSIQDNGIGIHPEYKERIFGLFKRLHTETEYSGTGIGLAICQRIVERYHGRIWIESQLGVGSTFYFTVPVLEQV